VCVGVRVCARVLFLYGFITADPNWFGFYGVVDVDQVKIALP